jgi:hypothetical protein
MLRCFSIAAMALSVVGHGTEPCIAQDDDSTSAVEEEGDLGARIKAEREMLIELTRRLATDESSQAETAMLQDRVALHKARLAQLERLHASRAMEEQNAARELARLQSEVELRDDQIHELKAHLDDAMKKIADLERARELPPLEEAEIKIFSLQHVQAGDAAKVIEALLGQRQNRVALDERTNSLVVAGKSEMLEMVEAVLMRLDASERDGSKAPEGAAAASRSLLLRIFWLADGLPEGEGEDPAKFLPRSVLRAMDQLGLNEPRLVTQTVNSLSRDANPGREVTFSMGVPALIYNQPAQLNCNGRVLPIQDGRAELEVQIAVAGPAISCNLGGSLVSPLGHYTVLGTANSVSLDPASAGAGMMGGEMGGYGREYGGRGGYEGGRGGYEGGGGDEAAGQQPPADRAAEPKFNTSHFAFVVQVVENESYAEEE